MITYNLINQEFFDNHEKSLKKSINEIWCNIEDSKKAVNAILRSFTAERDSFHYSIEVDNKIIWITGFYALKNSDKLVWLNHHWIQEEFRWKWLWKSSILDLSKIIKNTYNKNIEWIIEIVPEWNTEIEEIFNKMWFMKLTPEEIEKIETIDKLLTEWYYKTAYILKI